jgi:hypothetical protein
MNDRDHRMKIDPRGRRAATLGLIAIVVAAVAIAIIARLAHH